MKRVETIKELIAKGDLPESALRYKVRRIQRSSSEEATTSAANQVKVEVKDERSSDLGHDALSRRERRAAQSWHMKKNGEPRAIPCRWSPAEHRTFIEILKTKGKVWPLISRTLKNKTET